MTTLDRTARTTGALYLTLGLSGILGFLLVRSRLFDPDNPAATLTALVDHEALAHAGVALELLTVLAQALAALWFFRLFRSADAFAAGAIAVFGTVNAVAILGSASLLATAVAVADDAGLAPAGDQEATVQLLYVMSDNLWGAGGLFFGLWLIPMGWVVLRSAWMPAGLGRVLVVGGCGYVLSTFVTALVPDVGGWVDLLVVPATIGEFWMIGYLLVRGVRPLAGASSGVSIPAPSTAP